VVASTWLTTTPQPPPETAKYRGEAGRARNETARAESAARVTVRQVGQAEGESPLSQFFLSF